MIDIKFVVITLFLLIMLSLGRAFYLDEGPEFNITKRSINITDSLSESFFGVNGTISNQNNYVAENYFMQRISNIIYAWLEFFMRFIVELVGFAIVFGFENPSIDFNLVFDLLFWFVMVSYGVLLVKPLLFVCALVYFGVKEVIGFIKKWKASKNE